MAQPEVVVVGGGQAGLATGYYLRRAGFEPGRDVVVVDAAHRAGGSWPRMWSGLRLFSPSTFSSLPGRMMPPWDDATRGFPPRDHVVDYLTAYEDRYELQVRRPHRVTEVTRADDDPDGRLVVRAPGLELQPRVVVSATGTWDQPFWPSYPGMREYAGRQLHAADYDDPRDFAGQRVVVVGGGNSAAQILAEVSAVAETFWVAPRPPRFLPDEVDGRALFAAATERVRALRAGRVHRGVGDLGDIVMVASVRDARARGVLQARPLFERLTRTGVAWADGGRQDADAVIWCTGFRPALRHLTPLHLSRAGPSSSPGTAIRGPVPVGGSSGTRALAEPRVHLVGYGDWVGPASATLIGVGRSAAVTVDEISQRLRAD